MPDLLPYKNKWLCSYETLKFDTADGDLGSDQYASHSDKGYYVRILPKSEGQFTWTDDISKIAGLEKVAVLKGQHCYYDEFRGADGKTVRIQSTGKKYWDTALIKGYPQPERTEMVSEIPVFPEDSKPSKEHHSIGLDAASNSGAKSYVSSYSWSHECTGDNRLLAVGDSHFDSSSDKTVTGITYDSVAMTEIRSDGVNAHIYYTRTSLYYLIAPSTGSNTVAVTLSGTTERAVGGATSYTGAEQNNQPDGNNGANDASDDTPTVDVTTTDDNSWVVSVVAFFNYGGGSLASDNTERWQLDIASYGCVGGDDTNGPKTPAGVQTMGWTGVFGGYGDGSWAISAASFSPATGDGDVSDSMSALIEVKAEGIKRLTFPLSALIEVEAEGIKRLTFPLSAIIEVKADGTLHITGNISDSMSAVIEAKGDGTKKLTFPLSAPIEVGAEGTKKLTFPLDALIEVKGEGTKRLIFPLSAIIEVEGDGTLHITGNISDSMSAVIEVKGEGARKLTFPMSAPIEVGAEGTKRLLLFSKSDVLINIWNEETQVN